MGPDKATRMYERALASSACAEWCTPAFPCHGAPAPRPSIAAPEPDAATLAARRASRLADAAREHSARLDAERSAGVDGSTLPGYVPAPVHESRADEFARRVHRGGTLSECTGHGAPAVHVLAVSHIGPAGAHNYAPACGAPVASFHLYFAAHVEPVRATCAECVKIVDSGEYLTLRAHRSRRF